MFEPVAVDSAGKLASNLVVQRTSHRTPLTPRSLCFRQIYILYPSSRSPHLICTSHVHNSPPSSRCPSRPPTTAPQSSTRKPLPLTPTLRKRRTQGTELRLPLLLNRMEETPERRRVFLADARNGGELFLLRFANGA